MKPCIASLLIAALLSTVTVSAVHAVDGKIVYQDADIQVIQGKTDVLIPEFSAVCSEAFIFQYNNGHLLVSSPTNRGKQAYRLSTDGGKTWRDTPPRTVYEGGSVYQYPGPDGEVITITGAVVTGKSAIKNGDTPDDFVTFNFPVFRSSDNGKTEIKETATLHAPTVGSWLCFDHGLAGLQDGTLLASASARFVDDSKLRTIILRSADRGKTWKYVSTVASGDSVDWTGPDGFAEPDLVALPDGKLLCFMRTGGGASGSPLALAESADNGLTWSNLRRIADRGVWPTAVLLENGVVAVFTGRPGNWIQFSANDGQDWVGWNEFDASSTGCDCSHYNGMIQLGPNRLLAVYCRPTAKAGCNVELVGTYFKVRRKN